MIVWGNVLRFLQLPLFFHAFHVLLPPLQFQIPSPSFIIPSRTYIQWTSSPLANFYQSNSRTTLPIYWSISSRKKIRTSSRYVHAVQPWKANVTWHNHNLRAWTCTKKRALTVWIPDMCCHCTTYVSRWTVRWPLFVATKQKQTTPPFTSPRAQSPKVGI